MSEGSKALVEIRRDLKLILEIKKGMDEENRYNDFPLSNKFYHQPKEVGLVAGADAIKDLIIDLAKKYKAQRRGMSIKTHTNSSPGEKQS